MAFFKGKKVAIIGAGPGGLSAAMLLASKGYEIDVYEKQPYLGGRTSGFRLGAYSFDRGPTFLNMPHILEELFEEAGRNVHDYVKLKELDPMYRLQFADLELIMTRDRERMAAEIERVFPGESGGYRCYMQEQAEKMKALMPLLQNKHDSLLDYVKPEFLKAIPKLTVGSSLYEVLSRYYKDERLRQSFTFQAKYLGMSPWECPGAFSILSYMEHAYGVFHPIGGVSAIPEAMARVVRELGGRIHLGAGVKRLHVKNGTIAGLELENGERAAADEVVINADFAHSVSRLLEDGASRRYNRDSMSRKRYSCSTFMLYLGVDRTYEQPHHTISFASDYRRNVEEISKSKVLSKDPSVYIQNAGVTDPTLAPAGHSAIYLLAPVPNRTGAVDWQREKKGFRELVLEKAEAAGFPGLSRHIVQEEMLTPEDWENSHYVHYGATFNLAHNLGQMMYFRPPNRFREFSNCWLTGGGTHPGSGLPTIMESARITVREMIRKHTEESRGKAL